MKVFPIFRLFPDDKIIGLGQTILLSSRDNLNMANTFVCSAEQLPQSNSDNNYLLQIDVLSRFRLYSRTQKVTGHAYLGQGGWRANV